MNDATFLNNRTTAGYLKNFIFATYNLITTNPILMKLKFLLLAATSVTSFFSPILSFAQAPSLGTAGTFVLFTSSGAVTNTGFSQLTGNVGTNSGAITGFGNVNGVMHTSNGTTAAAAANLLTAYQQLDDAVPTASHAPLLGNGETLNAGTYLIAGNTVLDNALTLDAQGSANAVFILQIQGTFSTTAASSVILANGALACNVFWKVEGAVSMAAFTSMKGNVIANNAALAMSPDVNLEGRAFSTTGAITLNGITAKTPIGCGSPILTGPGAPNLKTTVCYALFSANGQVTNSGVTYVTGDVGTNSGLTSGYDPLLVNGTIHENPDGSTSACAADLLTVYDYLHTLTNDIQLLYPAQFGNGLTLTPHTYLMSSAVTLTDTVFLNAENNADAIFVIKVNGAFSTSTFATVTLLNGAQAKNVFWVIDGAVNINNNSDFKGTIICNNAAITLGVGAILNGRALTTTGALSTNAINATITAGCTTLPLSLLNFSGQLQNADGGLVWKTTNETNTANFEVERSLDGRTYNKIGMVAAAGTSSTNKSYSFTDKNITSLGSSVVFYRLKMKDVDNKFSYSGIVTLRLKAKGMVTLLYPNPVKTSATLTINADKNERITYSLIDLAGRVLQSKSVSLAAGSNTLTIDVSKLVVGVYSLSIQGEQTKERIRFVKQ